jgi:plasmid rolling circle replication initiator protein Rep
MASSRSSLPVPPSTVNPKTSLLSDSQPVSQSALDLFEKLRRDAEAEFKIRKASKPGRGQAEAEQAPRRLSDDSPTDKPWDTHGAKAQSVMSMMSEGDDWQQKKAANMEWCGRYITFAKIGDTMKLRDARFCRVRLCPRCQWRKSLAWKARWYKAWPEIQKVAPKARYFHMVLTVKNVPVNELRATLQKMTKAWDRMRARKTFPGIGFVRATEVTISEKVVGEVHPHFHVLMMVKNSYFKDHNYMNAATWQAWWANALDITTSEVNKPFLRAIDPKCGVDAVADAVREVFKYAVKFETKKDERVNGHWRETFLEMDRQLKGTQATSLGGILRTVFRGEEDVTEDEMLGAEESAEEAEEYRQYVWRFDLRFYAFHKNIDKADIEEAKSEPKPKPDLNAPLPEPLLSSDTHRLDWELNRAVLADTRKASEDAERAQRAEERRLEKERVKLAKKLEKERKRETMRKQRQYAREQAKLERKAARAGATAKPSYDEAPAMLELTRQQDGKL